MSNAMLFFDIPGCERLTVTYYPRTDGTRRDQVRDQVTLAQWLREFIEEWRRIERNG